MNLKVMTFNLRINVSSDGKNAWPNRIDAVAEKIRESGAVIVGTQEGTQDMIMDLAGRLPEFKWLGEGRGGGMKDETCVIFYRKDTLEAVESGTFWLSETPEVPASLSWNSAYLRICTWAKFKSTDGCEIFFFNTHLDNESAQARLNGIKLIAERIRIGEKQNKLPVFLCGDFNIEPDSEVIKYLKTVKVDSRSLINSYDTVQQTDAQWPGMTFHDFKGGTEGEPIDYIFVSSDIKIKETLIDRNQVNGKYPSDHYPVCALLEI